MADATTQLHLSMAELQAGLEHIRRAPTDNGTVEMIVLLVRKL